LFRDPQKSNLRVLGVSGHHTEADLQGRLVLALEDPTTGEKYLVDLGIAHSMKECPVNLLSISLLIEAGSTVHFEAGNCWFQPRGDSPRIPFRQHNGLFTLLAEDGSELLASREPPVHAFTVNGQLQYADPATFFGHTVSTDLKEVPFLSFLGYRYAKASPIC